MDEQFLNARQVLIERIKTHGFSGTALQLQDWLLDYESEVILSYKKGKERKQCSCGKACSCKKTIPSAQ